MTIERQTQHSTQTSAPIQLSSSTQKILVLFCGGTILMEAVDDGSLDVPGREAALTSLKSLGLMLRSIADIDLDYIVNIDSSNMHPVVWEQIADKIIERYEDYDGFVLIHGTDTMAYSSSALALMLRDLGKPVVLTGAQIPASQIETDTRRNLINAVRVATMDLSGVYVVFDQAVFAGGRVTKVSESRLNAFESINERPVAEICVDIRVRKEAPTRHDRRPTLVKGFDTSVAVLSLFPGIPCANLLALLETGVKGFVIRAFGSGNIPDTIVPFLERAREADVPVVLGTQCIDGRTVIGLYEAGKRALDLSVIQAHDMSLETMTVKLMWLLGQGYDSSTIAEKMHTSYTGEVDVCS
ncbi:L-asparaginase 1 [Chlamydiales bacterium SCGC AG-110-P3]|nr:L-asparaginase 1 [Chlamydiales bacterium SCGC AG-110-P3]